MDELNSEEIDILMKLMDKIKAELSITDEGKMTIPENYSLTLNEEQITVLYKFFNEVKLAVVELPELKKKLREHFQKKYWAVKDPPLEFKKDEKGESYTALQSEDTTIRTKEMDF